ncbi:YdcF family protein [Fusobacterium sp.]|uniref:YdcF family protein n=1 Tax=Fusobacterium sp. TaxID=68766 RepID=UPI002902AADF|nr:YdcF family protein [Fusobacterium sp.]MDU1911756.1 YdcF family protein [Fusobacterium sp.]
MSILRKRKINVKFITFGMGIFLSYLILTGLNIWKYKDIDEKQQADVVIVLGASTYNNEVSLVFKERLNHGIWLYKNNYVKKLIFTGGIGEKSKYSDAFIAKQYAIKCGIPAKDIFIEEKSTITQENLKNAKLIMDKNLYQTAIIVSDPLHMKRSMLMAKDYELKAFSSPTPTTRYISINKKLTFLIREEFFYIGYQISKQFIKK